MVALRNEVSAHQVRIEFNYMPGALSPDKSWEDSGTITFAFTNKADEK